MRVQHKTIEKIRELINEETKYRSGPKIIEFFRDFGCKEEYGQGFPSRWKFTDHILNQLNGTSAMEKCIEKLLSPVNFIGKFDELKGHIKSLNEYLIFDNYKILLNNKNISIVQTNEEIEYEGLDNDISEDEFLKKEFEEVDITTLNIDIFVSKIISDRLIEIKSCLQSEAPLATIFLCGSCLEGILLAIASQSMNIKRFNQSKSAPHSHEGKVKQLSEWSLSSLIDVSCEIGLLQEDVKKFSHSLREFRNYIHPYKQASVGFTPSKHTAKLCWQVLKLAIKQIKENIKVLIINE